MADEIARASRAEQLRWQKQASDVLGTVLRIAGADELPILRWTVQLAGCSLLGKVASREDGAAAGFAAWKRSLSISFGEPIEDREVALSAERRLVTAWRAGRGDIVRLVLMASIWRDEEGPRR